MTPYADKYRPGHADYVYDAKYGHDYRGGGRASARETAVCRRRRSCPPGASRVRALQYMPTPPASDAWHSTPTPSPSTSQLSTPTPCAAPDADTAARMEKAIREARAARDTLGGVVTCVVTGVPRRPRRPCLRQTIRHARRCYDGHQRCQRFDYGDGFAAAAMPGSKCIDLFQTDTDGRIVTDSNHSGGIQGGISNGMPIVFRVAFKPIATMPVALPTVDSRGNDTVIEVGGRHDVCVVPRAVPVVEAMAAMTLLDAPCTTAPTPSEQKIHFTHKKCTKHPIFSHWGKKSENRLRTHRIFA